MTHCKYCDGAGLERGFLWTENNGPIIACPMCNAEYDTSKAQREREYDRAEYQRRRSELTRPNPGGEA